MNKKMFIFDCDGTLVNDDRQISKKNLETLNHVLSLGHKVVICTGRTFAQIGQYHKLLPQLSAVASMNGCIVDNLETHTKQLLADPIKPVILEEILRLAMTYKRELHWCGENEIHRVYFGTTPQQDITEESFFLMGTPNPTYENWNEVKQYFNIPILHIAIKAEASLVRKILPPLVAKYGTQASIVTTGAVYIDVNAPGINKYRAVKVIQEMFGISNDDTYCFGDSDNDLSMLTNAGHGICMGNGTENAKKAAQYIIGSNNTDGISDFINNVIAGKPHA